MSHRDDEMLLSAQAGDQDAITRVLLRFRPLVEWCVSRRDCPQYLDREDMTQEAQIALLKALKVWDPNRGAFSTIATIWMMSSLGAVRDKSIWALSTDAMRDDHDADNGEESRNPDEIDTTDHFAEADARVDVTNLLDSLPKRTQTILRRYWGIGAQAAYYRVIGDEMGLSRPRVQQLATRAISDLRERRAA